MTNGERESKAPSESSNQINGHRLGDALNHAANIAAIFALSVGIEAGINHFKPNAFDFLDSPKTPVLGYLIATRDRDRDMNELQGILQDELKPELSQKTTALIMRLKSVDLDTYQRNVIVRDMISDAGVRMVTWEVNDPNLPHTDPNKAHDITVEEFSAGNKGTFEQISLFADKDDNLTNDGGPAEIRVANEDLVPVGERTFNAVTNHVESKKFDLSTVGSFQRSDVLDFYGSYWKMYDGIMYSAQERVQRDWRTDQQNVEVGASRDGRRWLFVHARSQEELDQEKRDNAQAMAELDAKLRAEKEAKIDNFVGILRDNMNQGPLLRLVRLISSLEKKEQETGELYLRANSYKLADGTVEDALTINMPTDEYSLGTEPDIKILRFTRPDGSVRDNLTFYIGLDRDFGQVQGKGADVLSPDEYLVIEESLFSNTPDDPSLGVALDNGDPMLIDEGPVDFGQVRGVLSINVQRNGEVIYNFEKEPL